ncbi:MAG: hypothetical protein HY900_01535 [Deltaproteobacteria bacterium]|nr:hypothetical protein [Deltaproteobacteria bacterium]
MKLIDFFDKGVELEPGRPFLIDDGGRRSYREVQRLSHRIANAFRRDGIAPGTRVAVPSRLHGANQRRSADAGAG